MRAQRLGPQTSSHDVGNSLHRWLRGTNQILIPPALWISLAGKSPSFSLSYGVALTLYLTYGLWSRFNTWLCYLRILAVFICRRTVIRSLSPSLIMTAAMFNILTINCPWVLPVRSSRCMNSDLGVQWSEVIWKRLVESCWRSPCARILMPIWANHPPVSSIPR